MTTATDEEDRTACAKRRELGFLRRDLCKSTSARSLSSGGFSLQEWLGACSLAFSPHGLHLAVGAGSILHILATETFLKIQTVQLDGFGSIKRCFYSTCCDSKLLHDEEQPTRPENACGSVIQHVDHPSFDPAAEISSLEAEQTQAELWASSVEVRNVSAVPQQSNPLLLLTFARQTQDLETALLTSRLATSSAWVVKPDWAHGAKIFTDIEPQTLKVHLPSRVDLRPWHVVVQEQDEADLVADIAHLPEHVRRFKPGIGRMVLYHQDVDSVQANVDLQSTRTESDSSDVSFFSCS